MYRKAVAGRSGALLALPLLLLLSGLGDRAQAATPAAGKAAANPAPSETEPGASLGLASVVNLRDLGGYATADGHQVARGLVYRSNQLSGVTPEDARKLAALGWKRAFDLRTAVEREKRPDELPEGTQYVWLDVLADSPQAGPAQLEVLMKDPKVANEHLGGGQAEEGFLQSYREFVSLPSARKEFRELFLALGDRNQLPAVFHCTTGKDRTGWAAAALLSLLGVPREVVMEDYLRSNDNILTAYQPVIDQFAAAGGDPAIAKAILGVKREYLETAFDEMDTKYGSIEKYFAEGLGIDAAGQQKLRETLLASN